jgi:hypothetical protein
MNKIRNSDFLRNHQDTKAQIKALKNFKLQAPKYKKIPNSNDQIIGLLFPQDHRWVWNFGFWSLEFV